MAGPPQVAPRGLGPRELSQGGKLVHAELSTRGGRALTELRAECQGLACPIRVANTDSGTPACTPLF